MAHETRLEIKQDNVRSFETFYRYWLVRQEHHLEELIHEIQCERTEESHRELIAKVLAHYADFYVAKAEVVQENVFLLFSAPWLTSFERVHLWITGLRPVVACRLLPNSVSDLTEDQSRRIDSLTAETREEERELNNVLARVQEYMVAPEMVALATQMGRLRNGMLADGHSTIERLRMCMEVLVACADEMREKTTTKILEILSSSQALRFLAAAAQFQLNIRRYGLRRDANDRDAQ